MNKLTEIKHSYRIFKLINGDEIICMLSNLDSGYFKVTLPLKMVTVDTMNKDGKYEENQEAFHVSTCRTRWKP